MGQGFSVFVSLCFWGRGGGGGGRGCRVLGSRPYTSELEFMSTPDPLRTDPKPQALNPKH